MKQVMIAVRLRGNDYNLKGLQIRSRSLGIVLAPTSPRGSPEPLLLHTAAQGTL
jgi:hypothetical protein